MAGRTSAASAGGWSTFGAWASKTPSARASWTSSAWPSSPASCSPPSARHPCRHRWTWPSTWCSAPSTTPEVSASSPPRASRPPPGTSVPGPARARSSAATTASPCTSKVLTTTPNASSPPWDVPPGRTSTTASSAHSHLAHPTAPGNPTRTAKVERGSYSQDKLRSWAGGALDLLLSELEQKNLIKRNRREKNLWEVTPFGNSLIQFLEEDPQKERRDFPVDPTPT